MAQKKSVPHFASQGRMALAGSEKARVENASEGKPATGRVTVSVIVRRKAPLGQTNVTGMQRLTRAQFNVEHASDPAAVQLVKRFAKEYGLTVQPGTPAPGRRTIKLIGTVANMQRAFGVSLESKVVDGKTYRVREGTITLPTELQGYVVAVLGLDNRPQAEPNCRVLGEAGGATARAAGGGGFAHPMAQGNTAFTPVEIGQLYQFPQGVTASGQTIALIELGGGFRQADINAYFKALGQTPPEVIAVLVGDGKNNPTQDAPNNPDREVMLDIEVAGAVAPGARIVVYFAANTDQGFIDAVAHAIHDTKFKPSVISISWGKAEIGWTPQAMTAFDAACQSAAALGITITVAAGDDGSTDGVGDGSDHVNFPASSPHVLACGGTNLSANGTTISDETVWNRLAQGNGATGGGVSNFFPLPNWQAGSKVPPPKVPTGGRGVPDIAGDADPATGYRVRVDGNDTLVMGGTSAVAPLWAGLIAIANKQNGTPAGFIQPALYAAKIKGIFRDILKGNNGSFSAAPGWDACTGLGSPVAPKVISAIKPSGAMPAAAGKKKSNKKKKSGR
jgi:kumamolisin